MDKATGNINKINEYLAKIDEVIAQGKFKDNWISLSAHKTPSWYRAGRFGIFIHWGVYSVPAFGNEWYPRNMYDPLTKEGRHHLKVYGEKTDYRAFIEKFKPDKYNAEEWAALFRASGARFVMPVCEHHDGVKMYASELNRWNMYALKGRDYIAELKGALEAEGLTFLASNHRAEHYWFMNKARKYRPGSEIVTSEEYRDLYGPAYLPPTGHADKTDREIDATEDWLKDWLASSAELVDRLKPSAVYFDWWIQKKEFKPYLKKFLAYYYNRGAEWGKEVTVFYKVGAVMKGCATFDVERGQVKEIREDVWQCDTAIARNSWGYTEGNKFKSPTELIQRGRGLEERLLHAERGTEVGRHDMRGGARGARSYREVARDKRRSDLLGGHRGSGLRRRTYETRGAVQGKHALHAEGLPLHLQDGGYLRIPDGL